MEYKSILFKNAYNPIIQEGLQNSSQPVSKAILI